MPRSTSGEPVPAGLGALLAAPPPGAACSCSATASPRPSASRWPRRAWTGGLADPTVGGALIALGYDRDFAAIDPERPSPPAPPAPAPGWQAVRLDGPVLRLPAGVRLDLGATAKGLGSDRAARAAMPASGRAGGVLVSLGGDIAVAGQPPRDGWPVLSPTSRSPPTRRPPSWSGWPGAVATSSITCRRWQRAGQVLHHIVDPADRQPGGGPWRTVSVAAATCADANAAATAAIVAGDEAEAWLAAAAPARPARLARRRGAPPGRLAAG